MKSNRENWVDIVKAMACVLVALGHFSQSMIKGGIATESPLYSWFQMTIYLFHVQLFFVCSGYLFQKYSKVNSFNSWGSNIVKKFIVLGVPYFVFSTITWTLKRVFSAEVNSKTEGLIEVLFIKPIAPYWYLFVLFFIFCITFTASKKHQMFLLFIISMLLKVLIMLNINTGIYAIDQTAKNWVWFVIGMMIAYGMIPMCNVMVGIVLFCTFLVGTVLNTYSIGSSVFGYSFLLGILACYSVISIVKSVTEKKEFKIFESFSKYTMPIFLMHTIFAAPLRSVLLKIGIKGLVIHSILGLLISFTGPIIAMIVLNKLKPLDFIIYPGRYIRFQQSKA
ncbi:MAG: acyltransferase [Butyrivibrio sp.]|nr:acyltransferase [Butyrivibrio sp.]